MHDPVLGTMIDRYRIERVLGEGGMGRVYLGVQPQIGSRVAIKLMSGAAAGHVDRFFAEARAVNLVSHDSIVKVIDLGVVLFEAATGRRPFGGDTDFAVMRAHVEDAVPRPSALRADISPLYEQVILQLGTRRVVPQYRLAPAELHDRARLLMKTLVLVLVAACGSAAPAPRAFDEQRLATAPGLSGLAVDEHGDAWTVAERALTAYRVPLANPAAAEAFSIAGVPAHHDLESIAALGGDRFAFGTEWRDAEPSHILFARRDGRRIVVTDMMSITASVVGLEVAENHGIEGLCGFGGTLAAAFESVGTAAGKRWAPVIRIEDGAVVRTHRLWLTSESGKISALDCRRRSDGALDVIAVERHFEVTHVLRFTLGATVDITPEVALDLGTALHGRLNLEGIAWLPDGDVIAVTDNQWKVITGPSLLLRLRPGSLE